jgi:hypothetical protein
MITAKPAGRPANTRSVDLCRKTKFRIIHGETGRIRLYKNVYVGSSDLDKNGKSSRPISSLTERVKLSDDLDVRVDIFYKPNMSESQLMNNIMKKADQSVSMRTQVANYKKNDILYIISWGKKEEYFQPRLYISSDYLNPTSIVPPAKAEYIDMKVVNNTGEGLVSDIRARLTKLSRQNIEGILNELPIGTNANQKDAIKSGLISLAESNLANVVKAMEDLNIV